VNLSLPALKSVPLLLFFFILTRPVSPEVLFDPPRITLPATVSEGADFSALLKITNPEKEELTIDFILSQEGWSVSPGHLSLAGGETAALTIRGRLDGSNDPVSILMLSDRKDVPYLYALSREEERTVVADGTGEAFLFFYSPGCGICEEFYDVLLPGLEDETGLVLNPERRNVYESGNYEYLGSLVKERGRSIRDFPVLIAGDSVFSGEKEIQTDFPAYVKSGGSLTQVPPEEKMDAGTGSLPDLKWLPVFLAGLLDGINPCAFTSLIFLISYLRLLGKKGSEILKIGGSFTIAVFLTYFLVGLGAFQFIRMADSFGLVSRIIKYLMGAGLFVLALLSLADYIRYRQGRVSESFLQLSMKNKKRIHSVVRSSSRSTLLYLSSFAAGFLISLYELGCTGQIYLPMLVYMVRQEHWNALAPLALYNGAFILPLVIVFALFYKGSDSARISEIFQRNLGRIKMATALLFLVMSVFILFF